MANSTPSDTARYYTRSVTTSAGFALGKVQYTYIRDRLYNCEDTLTRITSGGLGGNMSKARAEVEALCAEWNADYEAFLAAA